MKPTSFLRAALLAGAAALLLSCAERPPLGPQADLLGLPPLPAPASPPSGLLQCSPLAADSVTQTIGPAGGTIALSGWSLPKQIVYTTDLLVILETLQSVDNPPSQTVTGQLQHFSDYAIAW